jgi:hypothetical protein
MMCANSYHVKCLATNTDVMLRLTYRYGICADHEEAKTVQQSALYVTSRWPCCPDGSARRSSFAAPQCGLFVAVALLY